MFGCLFKSWSQAPIVQMDARGQAILMRPKWSHSPGLAPLTGRTHAPAAPLTFLSSRRPLPPALPVHLAGFTFAAISGESSQHN